MANPFVHVELNTTDLEKAKAFYGELFDWKLEDMLLGPKPYTMIRVGQGTGGGVTEQSAPGTPSAWLPYIIVDNALVATEKARSMGAMVVREVSAVGEMGWMSIITDPTGATLGMWQAKMPIDG
jgi:uncharacterized protein